MSYNEEEREVIEKVLEKLKKKMLEEANKTVYTKYPPFWRPENPGDYIFGRIVRIEERESKFGGTFPLLIIETEDGTEYAVFCNKISLRNAIESLEPKEGDYILILYKGERGRMKLFGVSVRRSEEVEEELREEFRRHLEESEAKTEEKKEVEDKRAKKEGRGGETGEEAKVEEVKEETKKEVEATRPHEAGRSTPELVCKELGIDSSKLNEIVHFVENVILPFFADTGLEYDEFVRIINEVRGYGIPEEKIPILIEFLGLKIEDMGGRKIIKKK